MLLSIFEERMLLFPGTGGFSVVSSAPLLRMVCDGATTQQILLFLLPPSTLFLHWMPLPDGTYRVQASPFPCLHVTVAMRSHEPASPASAREDGFGHMCFFSQGAGTHELTTRTPTCATPRSFGVEFPGAGL
ncbi:unnamed protein product [Prorocentrum cordatum]|uniref:Uncharacterized protein n=1 Tax=Prorocentrum cordatum TaxID=2364126 RepID=A0ABN9WND1_9DINO|nr:unnamed protein product [Polarella glacialis]